MPLRNTDRPFIGYGWSLAIQNAFLILVTGTITYFLFNDFLQTTFSEEIEDVLARDKTTFIELRNQEFKRHIEVTNSLLYSIDTEEELSKEKVSSIMEASWPRLKSANKLNYLSIYDQHWSAILTLGKSELVDIYSVTDHALNESATESAIFCNDLCYHRVVQTVALANGSELYLLSETPISSLIQAFSSASGRDSILARRTESFLVPISFYASGADNLSFFKKVAEYNKANGLEKSYIVADPNGDSPVAMSSMKLGNPQSGGEPYLFWYSDITSLSGNIRSLANLVSLSVICLMLVFLTFTAATGVSITRRASRVANALPLLTRMQYKDARQKFTRAHQNRFYKDEIDLITESTLNLTDKLEELQNEINDQSEKLSALAYSDSLTDLPNRASFYAALDHQISLLKHNSKHLGLLFIDIDKFKTINDTYGHHIGDQLLITFSYVTKQLIRDSDGLYRLAGDEFVVIANNLPSEKELQFIASKIIDGLKEPQDIRGIPLNISVSIGGVLTKNDHMNTDHLLAKADEAMYQSKQKGRDQYTFYGVIE